MVPKSLLDEVFQDYATLAPKWIEVHWLDAAKELGYQLLEVFEIDNGLKVEPGLHVQIAVLLSKVNLAYGNAKKDHEDFLRSCETQARADLRKTTTKITLDEVAAHTRQMFPALSAKEIPVRLLEQLRAYVYGLKDAVSSLGARLDQRSNNERAEWKAHLRAT